MSVIDTLTDGRLALARNNIGIVLADLDSLQARASELAFCDKEWQMHIDMAFGEIDGLLREALEALG